MLETVDLQARGTHPRPAPRTLASETATTDEVEPAPSPGAAPPDDRWDGSLVSAADCEAALVANLGFIRRQLRYLARRHTMSRCDLEDLEGWIRLRLVQDDYAVLRRFEGRSRLTTYLTTVTHNLFRDFRIQRWGKWRPSAAARRMSGAGVQLEALLYRDGFELREAMAILRQRLDVDLTDGELGEMAARLRPRRRPRFDSDPLLGDHVPGSERADADVLEEERLRNRGHILEALHRSVAAIGAEDRLILRMRFGEGMTVAAIAAALRLDQRRLYRRVRRLLLELRRSLEERGVDCQDVLDVLA